MTSNRQPDLSNYVNPYSTPYEDPYDIRTSEAPTPFRILFAELERLFYACARASAEKRILDVAIVLPGTMREFGKSMDAQYLYPVTSRLQTMCDKLGLGFDLDAKISWECDDLALGRVSDDHIVEKHHLADLVKYFPPQGDDANDLDAWVDKCRTRMIETQTDLFLDAKETLSTRNLIVVGGPRVNQVMANLCHIFLLHFNCLGELGMYLVPPVGNLPLKLRRVSKSNKWDEWLDRTWEDRSIGWVHMMRNPWATREKPRFLIYIGGFYAQGTPAAMKKLSEIFDSFLDPSMNGKPNRQTLLEQNSDFRIDGHADQHIPAHVVEAQVKIPLNWFFEAKRPGLNAAMPLWSITPPAFEGSIAGFIPVLEKSRRRETQAAT